MPDFPYPYTLVRSDRKTVCLQLSAGGALTVRAPRHMPQREIDAFLQQKRNWLEKHLARQTPAAPPFTDAQIRELARQARVDLAARAQRFAPLAGVHFGRITIRCQRSKWGSCSVQGNLNFNCLLMLCPEWVRDYVVIHELCHRREMNHSTDFWAHVARLMPDYSAARAWLRQNGGQLIRRIP